MKRRAVASKAVSTLLRSMSPAIEKKGYKDKHEE